MLSTQSRIFAHRLLRTSLLLALFFTGFVGAQEGSVDIDPALSQLNLDPKPELEPGNLDSNIENLKERVLELNRDLLILEEELLYPANSQIALYLSMDIGEYFALDAVKVKIDEVFVASELYSDAQVDALFRGGIQKLYLGNVKAGTHEISAFFTGIGPKGQAYKRATSITIEKRGEPFVLELRITDSTSSMQPEFDVKQWDL